MKLIAFLGTGNYREVTYDLDGFKVKSLFPFHLLYKKFEPQEVIILSTSEGFKKWSEKLDDKLSTNWKKKEINIPRNSKDVWDIHRIIDGIIEKNDEIVMDITYSLRHIPLISFSTLIYEIRLKGADVLGLYYGAFEVNNQNVPVFNIKGALSVIEWQYALMHLKENGSVAELKEILKSVDKRSIDDEDGKYYGDFNKIVGTLNKISESIHANLNVDVLKSCYSLTENLKKYDGAVKYLESLYPPIGDMGQYFEPFLEMGVKDPEKMLTKEILEKLLKLAEYQKKIGLLVESMATLREWIVSFVIYICKEDRGQWLGRDARVGAERGMGAKIGEIKGDKKLEKTNYYYCLNTKDPQNRISKLWDKVIQKRNLTAHAGMSKDKLNIETYRSSIDELLNEYKALLKEVS